MGAMWDENYDEIDNYPWHHLRSVCRNFYLHHQRYHQRCTLKEFRQSIKNTLCCDNHLANSFIEGLMRRGLFECINKKYQLTARGKEELLPAITDLEIKYWVNELLNEIKSLENRIDCLETNNTPY